MVYVPADVVQPAKGRPGAALMWYYYLFRLATAIAPYIPFTIGVRIADFAGWCAFTLNGKARLAATDNALHVLGYDAEPAVIRRTVLGMFRAGARNYYDLFRIPPAGTAATKIRLQTIGWEYLDQAMASGTGAIIVAPHLGSFEMVLQLAIDRGLRITVPVERLKPERLFNFMVDLRSRPGLKVVAADKGSLRAMYQALRQNEAVLIVPDRDVLGIGAPVQFFGAPTTLPTTPAIIALRTGAPIIPGCTYRTGDSQYAIHIFPPLPIPDNSNNRDAISETTANVCRAMEHIIQSHPDQWVALQPVWPRQAHD
jgi:KDO2-lipid IV(A) lauroyltransferase